MSSVQIAREEMTRYLHSLLNEDQNSRSISDKNELIRELGKCANFFEQEMRTSTEQIQMLRVSLQSSENSATSLQEELEEMTKRLKALKDASHIPRNKTSKEVEEEVSALLQDIEIFAINCNVDTSSLLTKNILAEVCRGFDSDIISEEERISILLDLKFKKLSELILLLKNRINLYEENLSQKTVLEKWGNINILIEENDRLKRENDLLRQREKRYFKKPLLRRRNQVKTPAEHMRFLSFALQNELTVVRERLEKFEGRYVDNPEEIPAESFETELEFNEFITSLPDGVEEEAKAHELAVEGMNRSELTNMYETKVSTLELKISDLQDYITNYINIQDSINSANKILDNLGKLPTSSFKKKDYRRIESLSTETNQLSEQNLLLLSSLRENQQSLRLNTDLVNDLVMKNNLLEQVIVEKNRRNTQLSSALKQYNSKYISIKSSLSCLYSLCLEMLGSVMDDNQKEAIVSIVKSFVAANNVTSDEVDDFERIIHVENYGINLSEDFVVLHLLTTILKESGEYIPKEHLNSFQNLISLLQNEFSSQLRKEFMDILHSYDSVQNENYDILKDKISKFILKRKTQRFVQTDPLEVTNRHIQTETIEEEPRRGKSRARK
ncbi:hypothetical protein PCE1_001728 [Barthelona sp. PCE]